MKQIKPFILIVFMILLQQVSGFSNILNLTGKNIALYLDNQNYSFYLENPNPKSKYFKELLFKDTPPTSYITLIIDGKPYKLEDLKLVQPFQVMDSVISGVFQLNSVSFHISFIKTNLALKDDDSVIFMISARNDGDKPVTAGARFLLDTVYGEQTRKVSIYTASGEKLEYDRLINQDSLPLFFLSGEYDSLNPNSGDGLFIYPAINEFKPTAVAVASWKRLDTKDMEVSIEPRARFKYNAYSNPDAAVAVFFKDITVRTKEQVNFGSILSTAKLSFANLKFSEPVTAVTADTFQIMPVKPAISNTNSATNQNQVVFYDCNSANTNSYDQMSMLQAQIALLEKATQLIGKVDQMISSSNLPQAGGTQRYQGDSSLGKGLNKAALPSMTDDPFEKTAAVPVPAVITKERPPVSTNWVTNGREPVQIIYTNTGISKDDLDKARDERDQMKTAYEKKLSELQDYYKNLLKQQEKEFTNISSDYQQKVEDREKQKDRNKKIQDMNSTIITLDKKIEALEELLNLNLDFESMPPERIEKIQDTIREIERKLR
jgi:hypothetical protein